jgi:O-antigen biosynthesis protein
MYIDHLKNFIKRNRTIYNFAKKMFNKITKKYSIEIPEITMINIRIDKKLDKRKRLNLLVPSLNKQEIFGGIGTALDFFLYLSNKIDADYRIIVTDTFIDKKNYLHIDGYKIVRWDEDSPLKNQIIEFYDRKKRTLSIGENDIFVVTSWWTAYTIYSVIQWQQKIFNAHQYPIIYIIQDYEPGFYPWSSRYLMAESTYRTNIRTIAIFNSQLLYNFFKEQGYSFEQEYYFDPVLNKKLRESLLTVKNSKRNKQVLIYGRPSSPRNALELIVASLRLWTAQQQDIQEWKIYSVGESHPDVDLSNGVKLKSLGKLTLDEYSLLLSETYMGISLMVSPHPSYPPLEMSTFGVRTITNRYANKDLSNFNENIISLDNINEQNIANTLIKLASEYPHGNNISINKNYVECSDNIFTEICEKIIQNYN